MANGEVGIKIKVSARDAVNNLNRLKTVSSQLNVAFKKVELAASRLQNNASRSFQKFGANVQRIRQKITKDMQKVKGSFNAAGQLGSLITGAGLGLFAKASLETAANAQALEVRLKLLTGSLQGYEKAQGIASKAATTFGMSSLEALEGVTNIVGRLKPLGQSLEDIEDVFFGFNTAAKLAGVSTVEASNAFRQLAQALGSGRLAGDEFRSISEQVPTILKPIADELGVTSGALKELAAEGKITSEVVLRSLRKIRADGQGAIAEILAESDKQVFKDLSNAFEDLKTTIGDALKPIILPLVKDITTLIKQFTLASPVVQKVVVGIGALVGVAALAAPAIAGIGLAFSAVAGFLASGPGIALLAFLSAKALPIIALIGGLGFALNKLAGHFRKTQEKQQKFQELLDTGSLKTLKETLETEKNTLAQLGNAGARSSVGTAIRNQMKETEERIKQLDREITKIETLNKIHTIGGIDYKMDEKGLIPIGSPGSDKGDSGSPTDPEKTPLFDALQKEQAFLEKALTMGSEKAKIEQRIVDLAKEKNGLDEAGARKAVEQLTLDQKRLEMNEQIRDVLATGMTNAVMGLIEGTKSLGESLAGIAKNLASMFLNNAFSSMFSNFNFFGANQAQGGYNRAGGFKAFQYGGVVNSPTLGMIGEGGESEYVIPSSKMAGAMQRYSAGARGGSVIPGGSGDAGTASGSSGSAVVQYTGPVLNFNGDDYLPRSAVPDLINTAAKRGADAGQSKMMKTFKNSRSQRASMGL